MIGYDDDLHAWALEQAALIERGDDEIDRAHVADEIRDVAKACEWDLYDALIELARLVASGRSPDTSGVKRCLAESPSLRARLPEMIAETIEHIQALPESRTLSAEQTQHILTMSL